MKVLNKTFYQSLGYAASTDLQLDFVHCQSIQTVFYSPQNLFIQLILQKLLYEVLVEEDVKGLTAGQVDSNHYFVLIYQDSRFII